MLVNLHIVNLALIDEIDVDFTEGLNILTGETGAGKSIIIGSIGIGLGGKYDTGLLRDQSKDGIVELLFSVDEALCESLAEEEIEIEDGEILISRRLSGGRTINRINDKNVTIGKLRKVAEKLISLHAQHEQRTLLKAQEHLKIVDNYSEVISRLKEEVSAIYRSYKEITDKLDNLTLDESERAKRLDYIQYEINDIESARLKVGEDEELEDIFRKASNAKTIAEITSKVENLMGYDMEMSAGNLISDAQHELSGLLRYDDNAKELVSTLTDIDSLISEFNRSLSDYIADMEYDDETLQVTEERLNLINTLKTRYGSTIDAVLSTLADLKKEEAELLSYEETKAELERDKKTTYEKLEKSAHKLSDERKKTAKKLTKTISEAMQSLNFNDVRFEMRFEEAEKITGNGIDVAEFYISTNIGEEMRPLVDVASGGELSRVMLAIKSVISESSDTPTLIFDEIDVGISGITAEKVGAMMHRLGSTRQIISITHLPQIAAAADTAYVIEKQVVGEKTITDIKKLDEEGRVLELARLLGGASITDSVLETAREMISNKN